MRLDTPGRPHLTYCTNIHAGESLAEVRDAITRHVTAVKARIAPARPFGVGLRLSAAAAETLDAPSALADFRALLDAHDLYVFTINGFPYGAFHGTRVKERVYLPDWLDDARLAYSNRLARLLVALLPDDPGVTGSVSTVPGASQARVPTADARAAVAERLLHHTATLHRLAEEHGRTVVLALEPEPCCMLETVDDTVRFFEEHLLAAPAVRRFAALTGLAPAVAERALRRHLGVCLDACHMAVEFEEPAAALAALDAAGIAVAKLQLSAGLAAAVTGRAAASARALATYADDVYLHQVVARRGTMITRYDDLPLALAALGPDGAADEWRIHCHVPVFLEDLGALRSTQSWLAALLALVRTRPISPHLEVETYTWDVLPGELRTTDVADAVARELAWVLECLT